MWSHDYDRLPEVERPGERSVPFPDFLTDELASLMTGKAPTDLVFISAKGGAGTGVGVPLSRLRAGGAALPGHRP